MCSHTKGLSRKQSFDNTDSKKKLVIRHWFPVTFFPCHCKASSLLHSCLMTAETHLATQRNTGTPCGSTGLLSGSVLHFLSCSLSRSLLQKNRTDLDLYFHVLLLRSNSIAWEGYQGAGICQNVWRERFWHTGRNSTF